MLHAGAPPAAGAPLCFSRYALSHHLRQVLHCSATHGHLHNNLSCCAMCFRTLSAPPQNTDFVHCPVIEANIYLILHCYFPAPCGWPLLRPPCPRVLCTRPHCLILQSYSTTTTYYYYILLHITLRSAFVCISLRYWRSVLRTAELPPKRSEIHTLSRHISNTKRYTEKKVKHIKIN